MYICLIAKILFQKFLNSCCFICVVQYNFLNYSFLRKKSNQKKITNFKTQIKTQSSLTSLKLAVFILYRIFFKLIKKTNFTYFTAEIPFQSYSKFLELQPLFLILIFYKNSTMKLKNETAYEHSLQYGCDIGAEPVRKQVAEFLTRGYKLTVDKLA